MDTIVKRLFYCGAYGLLISLVAILASFWIVWSGDHDKEVAKASELYEKCVIYYYGEHPSGFYEKHGFLPECNTVIEK